MQNYDFRMMSELWTGNPNLGHSIPYRNILFFKCNLYKSNSSLMKVLWISKKTLAIDKYMWIQNSYLCPLRGFCARHCRSLGTCPPGPSHCSWRHSWTSLTDSWTEASTCSSWIDVIFIINSPMRNHSLGNN